MYKVGEKTETVRTAGKVKVKCVIVGDSKVGKTCLATRLSSLEVPSAYVPTTFDSYVGQ